MLAIELNEIHSTVSRSFVRPRATTPSLPFPSLPASPAVRRLSRCNIKEMKTLGTSCVCNTLGAWKRCTLQASRRGPQEFSPVTIAAQTGLLLFQSGGGRSWGCGAVLGVYLFVRPDECDDVSKLGNFPMCWKNSCKYPGHGLLKILCEMFKEAFFYGKLLSVECNRIESLVFVYAGGTTVLVSLDWCRFCVFCHFALKLSSCLWVSMFFFCGLASPAIGFLATFVKKRKKRKKKITYLTLLMYF